VNTTIRRELQSRHEELLALCRKHGVASLDLFGSGTTDEWQPSRSDLDFLVTFRMQPGRSLADRFLSLAEELEALFGVRVDLLTADSIRNPYLREAIESTRTPIYAE